MKTLLIIGAVVVVGGLALYGALQIYKNIFPIVKKDAQDIGDKLSK